MIKTSPAPWLALAAILTGLGPAATLAADPTLVTFDRVAPGAVPPGVTTALTGRGGPVRWAVVEDAGAAGGRALAQTSTDATDTRFPIAVFDVSAKDLDVNVRFRPVAGRVDRAAGVAVRVGDADNYYVARANALEDNVRFYRVVRGNRQQLAGANVKVASGEWQTLGLKAEGDRFTVSLNGKALFTATDRTFAGAGKVALWTKADSVTHFDRLEIRPLP